MFITIQKKKRVSFIGFSILFLERRRANIRTWILSKSSSEFLSELNMLTIMQIKLLFVVELT